MTNPLFTKQTLQFESALVDTNLVPISNITDAKFGILSLEAISIPLNHDIDQEFVFMVDCSGSMSDQCSDGRTKMQHNLHTLKNMILYFKENSIKVYITINTFDDKIYNILCRTTITEENFTFIMAKIDKIIPRGSTNIEKALEHSRETIERIKTDFPDHNISHIFMTDGEATTGNESPELLSELVDRSVTNAFIGFGIDHDSVLLNQLGSGENSGYYFVDKLENCGFVYGEVLHSILYKLLNNVVITIENGLIYDFKNNIWSSTLNVGQIVSELKKVYHIISSNPSECVVTFSGLKISDLSEVSFCITGVESEENLTKYVYRQRTLQYLFRANDYLKKKNVNNKKRVVGINNNWFLKHCIDDNDLFIADENLLKKELVTFITEMKQYMTDNQLTDDGFMKNLCDDIYICYKTFDTKFGAMYVGARQTSQGTQRGYTVSHTPDDTYDCPPVLQRHNAVINSCFNCDNLPSLDELPILQHELSDFADAPYLTPSSAGLMREISCGSQQDIDEQES